MPGRLDQKTILITGATGIAAATALLASREGAQVFIASLVEEDCAKLAGEIRGQGGVCGWRAADLTMAAQAEAAVEQCARSFSLIDGLFNVAGISGRKFGDGPLDRCTEEGWDTTMAVNAKSIFLVTRAVLRHMMDRPLGERKCRGSILHMSSVTAFSPETKHFATHAYAASKGAAIALTQTMAAYYAPHKIRVNALAPGLVRTPMSQRAQEDKLISMYMKIKQPLAEDMIDPEEIARAAVFFLSDESRMITGQILAVDAGWSLTSA
jgi:NAD(P)-dependent dehydrogenase (short-subunit alcohol dehydrogenase family)